MEVLTRAHRPEDLPLVFDSYLKSWRVSKFAGAIPNHLFFDVQRAALEDLLGRGASLVIAYPSGREDVILGWACAELKEDKTVLHYLYTKDPYIGLGIDEKLLSVLPGSKPGFVTHRQNIKATREWRWTPEIARRKSL